MEKYAEGNQGSEWFDDGKKRCSFESLMKGEEK
jgi:hypothetical protein